MLGREKGVWVMDGRKVDFLSAELNGPDFALTGVADIEMVMEKEGITGISGIRTLSASSRRAV